LKKHLEWAWPALELPTTTASFTVSGLVVPYSTLCWLDREGGHAGWQALNPTPDVPLPSPTQLFLTADIIVATGRPWEDVAPDEVLGLDPFGAVGADCDDVLVFGTEAYSDLAGDRVARPAVPRVLVVPLDLATDELFRLACWVEYLRGHQEAYDGPGPFRDFCPAPWTWDRLAGARE
jgi:hypothetical protein